MIESLEYEFKYVNPIGLEIHPIAEYLPKMDEELWDDFLFDVAEHGVKVPLHILKGTNQVIDGRHRLRAAKEGMLSSVPIIEVQPEAEGLEFYVLSMEEFRKKTSKSQMAMIYSTISAKILLQGKHKASENLKVGTENEVLPFRDEPSMKLKEVATKLNVSEKTLKEASQIQASGNESLIKEVTQGDKSVEKAVKEVREKKKEVAKATFNKQDGESIEWAKWSWNPITGCEHTCEYCYAREIAERFRGSDAFPNGFDHRFIPERLEAPKNTKLPKDATLAERNVFMGSMTDFWGKWQDVEEQRQVIHTIDEYNQWNYLSLTKDIKNVLKSGLPIPKNMWIGATVDNKDVLKSTLKELVKIKEKWGCVTWISFEPMFDNMLPKLNEWEGDFPDWFVIGGASATSNTPKYEVPFDEVVEFRIFAKNAGVKLYMKTNLIERIKELPNG